MSSQSPRSVPGGSDRPVPIDSDIDVHVPVQRRERGRDLLLLGAIALGGALGAVSRYGVDEWLPHQVGELPGATVAVNVSGCLLLGVLMSVLAELSAPHRLLRPFLGVGVLGGYTTFSTASVDVQQLVFAGRPALAWMYLVGTAAAALVAVCVGMASARAAMALHSRRWRRTPQGRKSGSG